MVIQISVAVIALAIVFLAVYTVRLLNEVTGLVKDVKQTKQLLEEKVQDITEESNQLFKSSKKLMSRLENKKMETWFTILGFVLKLLKLKNTIGKGAEKTMGYKNESSKTDMLLGAVAGGVIGAAAALLLAPKSGEETRSNLKQYSEGMKIRMEEVLDKMNDILKLEGENAVYKEKLKDWMERIKTVTSGRMDGDEDSIKIKNQLDEINNQLEEIYKEVAASSTTYDEKE